MTAATHDTIFDRCARVFRGYARSVLNARYAAMDLKRLSAMSDAELAYRGLTRDDIAGYVRRRYAK
ncbi:MAG: DUF1127 domain-containing protein [Pseudomonadota bacterium]